MTGALKDQVAIVTGSTSGIGEALAKALAAEGAHIILNGLGDPAEIERQRVAMQDQYGVSVRHHNADMRDPREIADMVSYAQRTFGRLDILVNNAAHQAHFSALEDISDEEWEMTFRTNIHAMFYLCKAAAPAMPKGGAIINTASINSDTPNPGLLAYATTKGAIQNFTVGLAQMLGPRGIRVNCVAPGPIWTPLIPSTLPEDSVAHFGENTPMGRPGQPAELASAYVLLADPRSSYTSGATIAVTGGAPMM